MPRTPQLLDAYGRPARKAELTREIAAASVSGVRSPITGYPGDGLDPRRLGAILREADAGDPLRYLELAETIEERDGHYLGVLGTRRRSVTQLEITVKDAGDDPVDVEIGAMVRDWLDRDELADELFDILDAIGKGYSFTEIIWDTSAGQWMPDRLEHRDPRWFGFDRVDLKTPFMRGEHGEELPLPGFKFIDARIKAKSGRPARSGLARVVLWPYLFKKYTERDWSVFSQTYGQPVRVGKFGPGATKEDRATLMRAVSNIAGDMAAIIPESMQIEFIETGNVSASSDLYKDRAEFYDKQVSKAVLGQTATTDAETGGLGSGTEHRLVQEDIERADAKALSAILNRDLVRPWVQLNHGPRARYPRIVIARPEADDLKAFTDAVTPWVDRGLEVAVDDLREKFGLREPPKGARILSPKAPSAPLVPPGAPGSDETGAESGFEPPFNGRPAPEAALAALTEEGRSAGRSGGLSDAALRLAQEAAPAMGEMLAQIEAMVEAASDLDELREMLRAGFPAVSSDALAAALGQAMSAAWLGGAAAVEEEADG
jgi:phage gp29-like protein